jgi:hypothetical protein
MGHLQELLIDREFFCFSPRPIDLLLPIGWARMSLRKRRHAVSKSIRIVSAIIGFIIISLACALGSGTTGSNTNQQPNVQPRAGTPLVATLPPIVSTFPPVASPPPATQAAISDPNGATSQPVAGSTSQPAESTTAPQPASTSTPKLPTATQTHVPPTSSPLAVKYEVVKISRLPDNQALLTIHVIATGGSGGYKYFNDNVLEPGDTFDVSGTCGAKFTHTLKVQASDGQLISLPYQVPGQCPTPTATPS